MEWPPSPWRLARWLVSAYYKTNPRPAEHDMLPVLKKMAYCLPSYCLPPAHPGHTRHYMPGITQEIIDAFLCVRGPLFILYPVSLDDGESAVLDSVLPAMQYLGRAESPCIVDAVDAASVPAPNCIPLDADACPGGGNLVDALAPRPGCDMLAVSPDSLSARPADLHKTRRINPPAGRLVQYMLPPGAPELLSATTTRPARRAINVVRFALVGSPLPHVLQSPRLGQAARSAVLSRLAAKSETLTGHGPGGGPARGHYHAMFLPTAEIDPARIDHITVVARSGFADADLETLFCLRSISAYKVPKVRAVFESAGTLDDFSGVFGRSRVWRTVTPVIFTKYTKYRSGGRVVDSPESQIVSEAKRRYGHDVIRVDLLDNVGRYRPLEFSRPRMHGSRGGQTRGVRVEFSREVSGPLALGYGSHYGMGLFAPEAPGHG